MDTVRASLARFKDVYAQLTPFARRVLDAAAPEAGRSERPADLLEIYPIATPEMAAPQSRSRSEAPNWLPGQDSNLQPSG